ncbi:MAG: DUF4126 domain-containing protein [Gammaproteobacteria bacterium]|nr:MAG: DUF4126 domain-containing protein [Gammaproteobacteria bacterium]
MDPLGQVALAGGLAWASGIRLYAVLFLAGALARIGYLDLPAHLEVLQEPLVMTVAAALLVAEFVADKVPAFDSVWDGIHTFIRVPAGAVLAAAALGNMDPAWVAVAAILGGTIASAAHATKAGSRALINTSPEPFSNWTASFAEDLAVPVGFWLAIQYPILFLGLLIAFIAFAAWLLPKIWVGLRSVFARLRRVIT